MISLSKIELKNLYFKRHDVQISGSHMLPIHKNVSQPKIPRMIKKRWDIKGNRERKNDYDEEVLNSNHGSVTGLL